MTTMMSGLRMIALACAISLCARVPVKAAMEPDNVAAEVEDAAKSCREQGGRPNTEAMLGVDDLNGDGNEDWIVDYAKLKCDGSTNPFCGSGGCSLTIYFWTAGDRWKSVFDETVQSYKVIKSGGKNTLRVVFSGSECGKTNSASCPRTYRFDRDAVRQVK
jgi:hypothetical protein